MGTPPSPPTLVPDDQARSPLWALVYVSKASRPLTTADLVRILLGARRRNLEEDITGVLLYADGSFMQYLEGPPEALMRVYRIIKAHPLHFGIVDLLRQPIPAREFGEWSMACHVVGADGDTALCERYDQLAARVGGLLQPRSPAGELLSRFWTHGRASVAHALDQPAA